MANTRKQISESEKQDVLLRSKRRCCLCFVEGNHEPRQGAIVQVTSSSTKSKSNLVFLCNEHHHEFDQGTVKPRAIIQARNKLYRELPTSSSPEVESVGASWKKYEQFVVSLISTEFDEIAPAKARLLFNQRYEGQYGYSRDVDIAAEVTVAGIPLLIVFEIKYAKRKLAIQDIEAFASKLKDVGANKGVFVTNTDAQQSAIQAARLHGIRVVQVADNPDESVTQVVTDSYPGGRPSN